ncbi:serine/threonine-protein kinase [Saccharomonospora viridis]|nr:serine/threonine-protein kinase [Saccharomonospora viridis]SFP93508.1 Serine/threonine protein kinase [Saccharomonospora viridis]
MSIDPTPAARPLAAGDPRQLGSYRVLGSLGEGGMGRVLLAIGPDGRFAAVKLVHGFLAHDPVFRERFRREIAACRLVSGAYTAPVLDADADAPTPWLATLYVPGPSLRNVVTTTGPLPASSLRQLAVGLATALADIHRAGLIHRDLKPGNVLLAHDGPRVIDFGIARAVEDHDELTNTGSIIGSPEFMSPEQALGHALTPATDVFSLGSVLVFAATGRSPFAGSSAAQALYNIAHTAPDLTGVPEPLRGIVAACLDKDAQRRPSPVELLDRITAVGAAPPGTAPWPQPVHDLIHAQETQARRALDPPPSPRTVRRWPILAMTAATVAAVGVAAALLLRDDSGTPTGHAAPEGPPSALPGQPTAGRHEDDPLSLDRLRAVDPCRVLSGQLTPQPAVHLSQCTYEHEDGRWFDLVLGDAVPVDPTPGEEIDDRDVGGLPLVVDHGGDGRCEAVAVLPQHADLGVSVTVGPGIGDVRDEPCSSAHAVLSDALEALRDNAPQRDAVPGSLATVDPCSLLDDTEVSRIFSVAPTTRPDRLHRCEWDVTGTLVIELSRDVDPADVPSQWERDSVGGRTVYRQEDPQPGSPSCALSWAHRPSDEVTTEVVSLRYRATATGRPVNAVCADIRSVAEAVIPRLPTP